MSTGRLGAGDTAIQPTIFDAKADILTATAADTPARLAVGNNGETLVADSSTTTGLRYNPQNSKTNPFINGGMDFFQRSTSASASSGYVAADRWVTYTGTSGRTYSRQTGTAGIPYALRCQRDSGNTNTNGISIGNAVEIADATPYQGKTVTVSFYAKAGANYSRSGSTLSYAVTTGTGTTEANGILSGYTGQATAISGTVTLTTSFQRFAFSFTFGASITQFNIELSTNTLSGTAGAADFFEVTGVQMDLGTYTADTAPTFRRAGGTLAGELAACQRYYFRQTATAAFSNLVGFGYEQGATSAQYSFFPVQTMRVKPSSVDFSAIKVSDYNSSFAITAFALNGNNADGSYFLVDATIASGGTAGRPCVIQANNNSAAYIGFSAEL